MPDSATFPPSDEHDQRRIIDANANRALEGLRVLEEYARFHLDHRQATVELKRMRHTLAAALATDSSQPPRLLARDTEIDVGTSSEPIATPPRQTLQDVFAANVARVREAFRVLEEYGKILADTRSLPPVVEKLRYRLYSIERLLAIARGSEAALSDCELCVLLDGGTNADHFEQRVQQVLAAGVRLIQLRDKRLPDRQLLDRARRLVALTRETPVRVIINDRADLAMLSGADGVHVGQDELDVRDARRLVTDRLVGVSTHDMRQAVRAVEDGANYLGCGPTFPSKTKSFDRFPGLEFLAAAARRIALPMYAIGGITLDNLDHVLDTGIRRIAIQSAIQDAEDPGRAAEQFLERLAARSTASDADYDRGR